MFNLFLEAAPESNNCENAMLPIMIAVAVVLIAVMVIFPMITNRKQKKTVEEQRGNLSVGDTIETVGGIIGVVKEIRQPAPGRKELVIETGNEGSSTTLVVDVQALYMVLNRVGGAPAANGPAPAGESRENLKLNEQAENAAVDPFENSEVTESVETVVSEENAPAPETSEAEVIISPEGKKSQSKKKKTK